jgi:hypothetical protein
MLQIKVNGAPARLFPRLRPDGRWDLRWNNVLLFPLPNPAVRGGHEKVRCRERLGGLLKYYEREAA